MANQSLPEVPPPLGAPTQEAETTIFFLGNTDTHEGHQPEGFLLTPKHHA